MTTKEGIPNPGRGVSQNIGLSAGGADPLYDWGDRPSLLWDMQHATCDMRYGLVSLGGSHAQHKVAFDRFVLFVHSTNTNASRQALKPPPRGMAMAVDTPVQSQVEYEVTAGIC